MTNMTREKIYACYKGDEYLCDGTLKQIHKKTGYSLGTLNWSRYPSAKKRASNRDHIIVINIDDVEEEQ